MEKIDMRIRIGVSILVLLLCFAGGYISANADDGDDDNTLFYVEVETYGKGIVTISDRYGVLLGEPVYLDAIAEPGYVFLGWFVKSGNPDVTYDTEDGREVTVVNTGEDVAMIAVFGLPHELQLDRWLFTSNNNVKLNLSDVVALDEASLYGEILRQAQPTRINVAIKDIYRYDRFVDDISVIPDSELAKGGEYDANILVWSDELDEMVSLPIIITVKDDIAPIITANATSGKITVGSNLPSSWVEFFNLLAIDETDGDITSEITFSYDSIDVHIPGTYTISADVKDNAGNIADTLELILNIVETLDDPNDPVNPGDPNENDPNETPRTPGNSNLPEAALDSVNNSAPITGDSSNMMMWILLFVFSLGMAILAIKYLIKNKHKTI